jgi:hypothetical protein
MAGRLTRGRAASAIRERIERPEAIALAVLLAIIAAVGWLSTGPVLAVSVALSLAIGGFGAIYLLGPAQQGLGLGRYMTMALAAAALTLFGRSLPGGVVLLLGPIAAVLLWSVIWLEMRVARAGGGFRLGIDLILVGVVFAGWAGLLDLFGAAGWPSPVILLAAGGFMLALRSAEARGRSSGAAAFEALLHTIALAEVAAALLLLRLPGAMGPALVALTFYTWSGAADALSEGADTVSVLREFGTLAILGVVLALLLHAA